MSKVQSKTQVRTPSGGMNQDDSLITPSMDNAGRNAFETGDYRYALNARIGSSKSDNFGDLENMLGTVRVENFFVRGGQFSNSTFAGSLAGWSQIDVSPGAWTYLNNSAIINITSQDILYQSISASPGSTGRVYFKYTINPITVSGLQIYLVFLNGTTVLSTELISSEGGSLESSIEITTPANCNGIGIQVIGTPIGISIFALDTFQFYSWIHGVKGDQETVRGKYEDTEFLRVYYAVHSGLDEHAIRYYDKTTNSIYELIRWSGLNFESDRFVKMAKIDNWLAMTDRFNRPRLIDVDTIADTFEALGSDFREFHISFHKWAPLRPPVIKRHYDGVNNNAEKFINKIWQFSYRYVYKGQLRSRFSPISLGANRFFTTVTWEITSLELYVPGFLLDTPDAVVQYNYFNHNNVKFTREVIAIEYAFRESQYDLWRIFKSVDVAATGNTSVYFTNTFNGTPVAEEDISQLFDTVPFLAGTVESVDNRFMFGDCLNEYEAAQKPIITDVGVAQSDGTTPKTWNTSDGSFFTSLSPTHQAYIASINKVSYWSFKNRGIYKAAIIYQDHLGFTSGSYTTDDLTFTIPATQNVGDTPSALMFKFGSNFIPPPWAVAFQIVTTNCLNIDSFLFGLVNKFDYLIDDPDAQISNIANISEAHRQAIDTYFANNQIVTSSDLEKIQNPKPSIAELVLRQVAAKNQSSTDPISPVIQQMIRKTKLATLLTDASRLLININNWYNSSKKTAAGTSNNPMNNLFYNYRKGDRVRFVGSTTSATPSDAQKQVFDMPILEFTGNAIIVAKPENLLWIATGSSAYTNISNDWRIEVYTPLVPQSENYIYYERGEWYPILYPGTSQRTWSKTDWTYTNNGAVTATDYGDVTVLNKYPMNKGDCHYVGKTNYRDFNSVVGSNSIPFSSNGMTPDKDRLFGLWETGIGRPNIGYQYPPVARFKYTQVRFGGKIVEQSFVNNINRFREEDQRIFPSEYGRIRGLINTSNAQVESVGNILLAIGEREAWSIYINRTTLEDLSGSSQVALSDKVLGSYNTLLGSHGTLNPESISIDRGRVHWWNAVNGCWVRYGRNGLTETSFYKMRNWFREIGALLVDKYYSGSVTPWVISGFDPFNEELVTLFSHSSLPETFRGYGVYKGAIFSEIDTKWKFIHSYEPDMFSSVGTQFISFKDGDVYLHEENDESFNTFYGVKKDTKWEPVFNDDIAMIKSWQAVAILSTHKWGVDRILSEYRGAKQKQQTSIPMTSFVEKEDNYYAPIPRDSNSPNVSNPTIEGNRMRSKAIQVLLTLDPSVNEKSLLHFAISECEDSPKNP